MYIRNTVAGAHIEVSKTVEVTVRMPPGEYYVSDPCYCFNDDTWPKIGELTNWWEDEEKPVFEYKGKACLAFSTAHGDGCFTDNQGREYGVDAGMIGLIPVEVADKEPGNGLGHKMTFTKSFRCTRFPEGKLRFGDIVIDTGDED